MRIKLGSVTVQAKALGIGAGRIALPKMIQKSMRLEDAFLVRNIKNPMAPQVLVINPAALDQELRRVRPGRTLGEIIDVLPFNRQGVPSALGSVPCRMLDLTSDFAFPWLRRETTGAASPRRWGERAS
jgi:hypothetical protein